MNIQIAAIVMASVICLLPKSRPVEKIEPIEPSVMMLRDGVVCETTVEEYVVGVVASEMPYTFHKEALKAQAVAARTYLYYLTQSGVRPHKDADICTDAAHCCAYMTEAELASRYGEKYAAEAMLAATSAAMETKGEILTYNGAPILSVWHSSSYGTTEYSEEIWMSALPYLVSVKSPENARREVVTLEEREVRAILLQNKHICRRITTVTMSYTASGRCETVSFGGVTLTGGEARRIFGLRSTNFSVFSVGGKLIFSVRGYGHGVGMSQYGADAMAKSGAMYDEILTHYYRGTLLS